MPRIRAPTQTVATDPLRTPSPVRIDASSGTEAIARGLGQVSDVAAGIAEKALQEQRRARLQDAFTELAKVRGDITSTARQQRGRDALETDLVSQSEQLLEQAADGIGEKLPENLRADFAQIRRQHGLGLRDALVDHVDREASAYSVQQYKGAVTVAQDLGIQGAVAARPGAGAMAPELSEARQTILNAVAAQTRTWAPEAATAERTTQLTGLHAGVVEGLARSGRAAEAFAYLAAARKEMDPVKAAALEKELAGPAQVAQALAVVQDLEARITDPAQRTEAVLALQGPIAEKAAQIHREREAMREELGKDLQRARFGRVTEAIEKGTVRTQSQLEGLLDFAQLTDEDRPRARKYLEDNLRAERTLAAAERAAQAQVDESARKDFDAKPLEERANMDVRTTYAGRASRDGVNVILKAQQGAAKDWNKDRGVSEGEFKRFVTAQVQRTITRKNDLQEFLGALSRRRDAWVEENPGKEPLRSDVKGWIVEELTIGDAVRGGSWLSPDRPRYKWPRGASFFPAPESEQKLLRQLGETPAPEAPAPGTRVPSEQLGYPPGGEFQVLPNGKYRRVK